MALKKILETKIFEYDTLIEREKHIRKMLVVGWTIKDMSVTAITKLRVEYIRYR